MEARATMTIRLPAELIDKAKRVKAVRESFNDLVIDALEQEVRRRQGLHAYAAIQQTRKQIEERAGLHPDSVPLIRALREEGRHA